MCSSDLGYAAPEERAKPWGTAHAAMAAREVVDGPFAIINADDYYGPAAYKEIYDYLSSHQDGELYEYVMVGYLLKNTVLGWVPGKRFGRRGCGARDLARRDSVVSGRSC